MVGQTGLEGDITMIYHMINEIDSNGDHRISLDEFITFLDSKTDLINNKNVTYPIAYVNNWSFLWD